MKVELLPDSRHYADELLALRRDNAALKVALRDSNQARDALRRELDDTRTWAAERVEAAAEQIARIRAAMLEVVK